MGMKVGATVVLALAFGLSSCSSGDGSSGADQSSVIEDADESTNWTLDEAGEEYEVAVKPSNENNIELVTLVQADSPNVSAIAGACDDQADAEYDLAQFLRDGAWPEDVQEPVDGLISEILDNRSNWTACAASESEVQLSSALTPLADDRGNAAENLRLALGLEPVPTS